MARSGSLEALLDYAQDKIVLLDEDGTFVYVNDAAERILGYDPEYLVGRDAFEFIHPEDEPAARSAFDRMVQSDTFHQSTVEYRFRRADGSWAWLESRMSHLTDVDLQGYVVSSRDVTDRIEAERDHRETTARLEELAATAGDVLWMFSSDWTELLFVNPAYEEIYGMDVEEVERDPTRFLEAVHPDDRRAVKDGMARLSAGEPVEIEYRVNADANFNRWVWVQAEPIVRNGEVVRITGFSRDVTERRRRERQLQVMDNLLRHNLRNDMNLILGIAALIGEESPDASDRTEVIRRTGEALLDSAEKERKIIDLLTTEVARVRVDLERTVAAVAESLRERFPESSIDLECPEDVQVYALTELDAAVRELLENAIEHSEIDRPTVGVSVQTRTDEVDLILEDTCPPMPDIEANVLTGEHDMHNVDHSSGMGLWLAYWIVDLSKGEIRVTADESTGNRIVVSLPRSRRSPSH